MGLDQFPATTSRAASRRVVVARWVGLLCLVAVLASCGGDSSPNPASPTSQGPRLLRSGQFALAAPAAQNIFLTGVTASESASGTWEVTVDWTSPSNTIWLWIANGACMPEQLPLMACLSGGPACPCQITARSEVPTPKPRVVQVPNSPGGTKTLLILNLGPGGESGTYQILFRPN